MLKTLALKVASLVAILAIGWLTYEHYRLNAALKAESVAKDQAFAAVARAENLIQGIRASSQAIFDDVTRENLDLGQTLARLKAKTPDLVPVSSSSTVVTIKDTVHGTVNSANTANGYCPTVLTDEYGRFVVSVPASEAERPTFARSQVFVFDAVVVKRLTGDYQFQANSLREYKPGSEPSKETEIPISGVVAKSTFKFLEEQAPDAKPFHPRIVVAASHVGSFGGGIEFLRYKDRLGLSALGFYDRKTGKADGAIHLGYRILNTSITVGPTYSPFTKSIGGAISLQITR